MHRDRLLVLSMTNEPRRITNGDPVLPCPGSGARLAALRVHRGVSRQGRPCAAHSIRGVMEHSSQSGADSIVRRRLAASKSRDRVRTASEAMTSSGAAAT